uniref:MARVEL domain-containing protein n=1 Tax=Strigamia maritima TaxID=126957 RepID=T1JLB1_STRMM
MQSQKNGRLPYFCCGCSLFPGTLMAAVLTLLGVVFIYSSPGVKTWPDEIVYVVMAIYILAFLSLVYAVMKSDPRFCCLWLIIIFLREVIQLIQIIIFIVVADVFDAIRVAIYSISLLITIYFWLVVWSFYRELKDQQQQLSFTRASQTQSSMHVTQGETSLRATRRQIP